MRWNENLLSHILVQISRSPSVGKVCRTVCRTGSMLVSSQINCRNDWNTCKRVNILHWPSSFCGIIFHLYCSTIKCLILIWSEGIDWFISDNSSFNGSSNCKVYINFLFLICYHSYSTQGLIWVQVQCKWIKTTCDCCLAKALYKEMFISHFGKECPISTQESFRSDDCTLQFLRNMTKLQLFPLSNIKTENREACERVTFSS